MEGPLAFKIEWFDELAAINKQFILLYFPDEPAVQINHTKQSSKHGGCFLKKVQYPNLLLEDLQIGNTFEIFSRKYTMVDYGDEKTRNMFQPSQGKGFMLVKPDAYNHLGKIIDSIINEDLNIWKLKMAFLDKTLAQYFAQQSSQGDTQVFKQSTQLLTEDVCVGIEVEGDDAVGILNVLWGNPNPQKAKEMAPNSFSAKYGSDSVNNAVYCSPDESSKDSTKFFDSTNYSAVLDNSTCWIIKPHWVREGNAGQIINFILSQGFEISGMGMFHLKPKEAEEFFEYSWGSSPYYKQLIQEITSGPWIALEVRKENAVEDFLEITGDSDPQSAHSGTIRGKFGSNSVKNAVYCSSAKSEGILEWEYFFRLLDD